MAETNLLKQAMKKINSNEPVDSVAEYEASPKEKPSTWQHFSFTCSTAIVEKVHNIAKKEGFSIRKISELFLQRGIDEYERKYGIAIPDKKDINELIL